MVNKYDTFRTAVQNYPEACPAVQATAHHQSHSEMMNGLLPGIASIDKGRLKSTIHMMTNPEEPFDRAWWNQYLPDLNMLEMEGAWSLLFIR